MTRTIETRPACAEDVAELAALFAESVRSIGPEHYQPDAIEAWAAFAGSDRFSAFVLHNHTLVAEERAEGLSGFGGIDEFGRITSLYVRPDRSRRGIGSTLLRALLEIGQSNGLREFNTEASAFSRGLFEKFGFEVVGTEVVERAGVHIERYRMERGHPGR